MHFDAINRFGYNPSDLLEKLVEPAEEAGLYVILDPWTIQGWAAWWARWDTKPMTSCSAYAFPAWYGMVFEETEYTEDVLIDSMYADSMRVELESAAETLAYYFQEQDNVWFYMCFDEAPARQWNRMACDTICDPPDTYYQGLYDDFVPNMFTQAMDSIWRPEITTACSLWLPTFEEVDPTGMVSWLKREIEEADETDRTMTMTFSIMHTLVEWADVNNLKKTSEYRHPPSFSDQATAVRSYLNMEYQGWGDPMPLPGNNYPDFFLLDAYPFRHVGVFYQDTASYTPTLGGTLEHWLLEHFEEGMDSTFIPAREIAIDRETDIPIYYWPQGFGRVGGEDFWTEDPWTGEFYLSYYSYAYRYPTPQEFLMNCNIALLRGAKGIIPFCLAGYDESAPTVIAGHLDRNHVPFDAPYEEWVYRDRPFRDTLQYIAPDLIPPFIDSPYDFDPLYDLPNRPNVDGAKADEALFEWKFAPYGRLWNSMRDTFGQIATMAPELSRLWWWEGYENEASIFSADSIEPIFVDPEIRIFQAEGSDFPYVFYVNRQCRQTSNPVEIRIDDRDVPDATLNTAYALDHSRRFIIPVSSYRTIHYFHDTLGPGQARLVEFIDITPDTAELRITSPDIWAEANGDTTNVYDFLFTVGDEIDVLAEVFNLGTESASNVVAILYDVTDELSFPEVIDRDTLSFSGLSTSGYATDTDTALFEWTPGRSDIGAHRLEVDVASVTNEPDTDDNSSVVTFLIQPRDYATEVLEDAWDMTEATGFGAPAWKTNDISGLVGWESTFSDSVSGMFEGTVKSDSVTTNRLYLALDSSTDIDGNLYNQVSLACISPNMVCDVIIGWRDTASVSGTVTLYDNLPAGNWVEIGPVDLSGNWSDKIIESLWLRFSYTMSSSRPVRIGWVKLTE